MRAGLHRPRWVAPLAGSDPAPRTDSPRDGPPDTFYPFFIEEGTRVRHSYRRPDM